MVTMKRSIKESLKKGEYYVWTVQFQDGEVKKVKIISDYIDQSAIEKHFGKPVAKINYNFGIHGGEMQIDKDAADEYHRQQDDLQKRIQHGMHEGSMGGINRSRPAQDVSYEKVLDDESENKMDKDKIEDLNEIFREVKKKWLQEKHISEAEDLQWVVTYWVEPATGKEYSKDVTVRAKSSEEAIEKAKGMADSRAYSFTASKVKKSVDEAMTRWGGYTKDDKKASALDKAPKGTMTGSKMNRFKELVQDTVKTQGLDWAYDYYVKKHGLPTRHFEIFAGVEPGYFDAKTDMEDPVNKNMAFGEPTSPLKGSTSKPFDQIVRDAIDAKGLEWAKDYFVNKKGVPEWEFNIFAKQKPTGLGINK